MGEVGFEVLFEGIGESFNFFYFLGELFLGEASIAFSSSEVGSVGSWRTRFSFLGRSTFFPRLFDFALSFSLRMLSWFFSDSRVNCSCFSFRKR